MRFPGMRNHSSPAEVNPHLAMSYNMASTAAGEEAGWIRERERRP